MKKVIITGAAGNLGREVCRYFMARRFMVLATVRNGEERMALQAALAGSEEKDEGLRVYEVELTDEAAVEKFAGQMIADHEQVHAALMLAGGFAMGGLQDSTLKDIHRQLSINFETAYVLTQALFPHMLERNYGRLVFVGTRPALDPSSGKDMVAYSLSKSLLFRLAEMLNAEAGTKDVVSSIIVPSTIDTPANRESMPKADPDNWVKPQQIAEILHLICSEAGAPLRETVLKIYGRS